MLFISQLLHLVFICEENADVYIFHLFKPIHTVSDMKLYVEILFVVDSTTLIYMLFVTADFCEDFFTFFFVCSLIVHDLWEIREMMTVQKLVLVR